MSSNAVVVALVGIALATERIVEFIWAYFEFMCDKFDPQKRNLTPVECRSLQRANLQIRGIKLLLTPSFSAADVAPYQSGKQKVRLSWWTVDDKGSRLYSQSYRLVKAYVSLPFGIGLAILLAWVTVVQLDTPILGLHNRTADWALGGTIAGLLAPFAHELAAFGLKGNSRFDDALNPMSPDVVEEIADPAAEIELEQP